NSEEAIFVIFSNNCLEFYKSDRKHLGILFNACFVANIIARISRVLFLLMHYSLKVVVNQNTYF
ncbi:hypothetical protein P9386_01190, partial [Caldifermentibacillus hisashii]|uniref:hypothetical protein n=1 Tax=Caldifermentibacillus hisashii TaxID=996558 RepID=UPI002E1ABBB4|nr:hypothetical protein [Caldifermentibacillus hisashii]